MIKVIQNNYYHDRGLFLDCSTDALYRNVPIYLNLQKRASNDKMIASSVKNIDNLGVNSSLTDQLSPWT